MKHVKYVKNKKFFNLGRAKHVLSAPFIWILLPIFMLSDLFIEIYHRICFPIYGLQLVKRSEYILIIDRNKLKYLTIVQKLFCMFCGYANGLLRYQKEIAGRTEHYWCGIMHEGIKGFIPQQDQIDNNFAKFNDLKDYKDKYLE